MPWQKQLDGYDQLREEFPLDNVRRSVSGKTDCRNQRYTDVLFSECAGRRCVGDFADGIVEDAILAKHLFKDAG